MPVINSFQITEQEKNECEDLLRSVIENWKALKNTSIKGLQDHFYNVLENLLNRKTSSYYNPNSNQ
jgi:hypothetical protein